jgi:hypothetical protein
MTIKRIKRYGLLLPIIETLDETLRRQSKEVGIEKTGETG